MTEEVKWERIEQVQGRGVPVDGYSINTDLICPARFLKCLDWPELGPRAFYDRRRNDDGSMNDHPFNQERYQGAGILFAGDDFGSGSSREHAPQALKQWGIRAIVAKSFAGIFDGNCRRTGIPAVVVPSTELDGLMTAMETDPALAFEIDLGRKVLYVGAERREVPFDMPEPTRVALINGYWDATKMLMANRDKVIAFEKSRPTIRDYSLEEKV